MGARKYQYVSVDRTHVLDDPVGPGGHLLRGFAPGAAVAKQLPIRALRQDLGGTAPFILAVIPFGEVGDGFGHLVKPGKFGGPDRAL